MTDDQLLASLLVATGLEDVELPRIRRVLRRKRDRLEQQFATTFDDDEMAPIESRGPTVAQALLMLNGELTSFGAVAAVGTTLDRVLSSSADPGDRIDAIFLATVGRRPDRARREDLLDFLATRGNDVGAYEDLMHALLVSSEFSTIH